VREAGRLVVDYFSNLEQIGIIRMRESKYCSQDLQTEDFISVLQDLFIQK
jgi:hypothetical protein